MANFGKNDKMHWSSVGHTCNSQQQRIGLNLIFGKIFRFYTCATFWKFQIRLKQKAYGLQA